MTDYISKDALSELVGEPIEVFFGRLDLKLPPTVEAEPVRHAHWIWKGDEGDSRFMCSACGGKENAPTCMGVPNIWEYCPNCGAKMEEYELARKRADTETD